MTKKKLVLSFCLAFLAVSVLVLLTSMVSSLTSGYGFEVALACLRLINGWIFGVLLLAALSLIGKIKEGEGIKAGYIVGLVLTVLSALSFFIVFTTGVRDVFYGGLILAIFFAIAAVVIPKMLCVAQSKANKSNAGTQTSFDEVNAEWAEIKARLAKITSAEKKVAYLEKVLLYFPIDMDINNDLDEENPVIAVEAEDGTVCYYTIAAAEKNGVVSETIIDSAKAYIALLVD